MPRSTHPPVPKDKVPCKICGLEYQYRGIKSHEVHCAKRNEKRKQADEFSKAMVKVLRKARRSEKRRARLEHYRRMRDISAEPNISDPRQDATAHDEPDDPPPANIAESSTLS